MITLREFLYLFGLTKSLKKRRHVKDVKPNENIMIEWEDSLRKRACVLCLNNDPKSKKILVRFRWGNYIEAKCCEYEEVVLPYKHKAFENFHLLNELREIKKEAKDNSSDFDLSTLQKQMNEALEKEEYEKANELQKKIDKLLKK